MGSQRAGGRVWRPFPGALVCFLVSINHVLSLSSYWSDLVQSKAQTWRPIPALEELAALPVGEQLVGVGEGVGQNGQRAFIGLGQVMRIKGVLGELSKQHSPQAGTWAWGSKKGDQLGGKSVEAEGCQVIMSAQDRQQQQQQQLLGRPSYSVLVPSTAWPVLTCGFASSCLYLCISLDSATTDQNPLQTSMSLKEKWLSYSTEKLNGQGVVQASWPRSSRT